MSGVGFFPRRFCSKTLILATVPCRNASSISAIKRAVRRAPQPRPAAASKHPSEKGRAFRRAPRSGSSAASRPPLDKSRPARQAPRAGSAATAKRPLRENRQLAEPSYKDRSSAVARWTSHRKTDSRETPAPETSGRRSSGRRNGAEPSSQDRKSEISSRTPKRRPSNGAKPSSRDRKTAVSSRNSRRRLGNYDLPALETRSKRSLDRQDDTEATSVLSRALPKSVHYTTAASEFLYGTSVVIEALKSGRRKPHVLYIYDGQNREESGQRRLAEKLASRRRVLVQQLPDADLMSKMSKGRPHNVGKTYFPDLRSQKTAAAKLS